VRDPVNIKEQKLQKKNVPSYTAWRGEKIALAASGYVTAG
jgi:hypothetical protein